MWKQIILKGIKFHYDVNEKGEVQNSKTGKLIKPWADKNGYQVVRLYNDDHRLDGNRTVHRLVATMFLPNPNNYPEVNHINGHKYDNRIENLEWCSHSYNEQHAYDTGLVKRGEGHYKSIYKEKQIREVCKLLEDGRFSRITISEMTGVDGATISQILSGHNWRYISKEYDFSNHQYSKSYKSMHKSIDRAILKGLSLKDILAVLTKHMDETHARRLYYSRKYAIEKGTSAVLCDVYVDDGEELF